MSIRKPAAAGSFYPSTKQSITALLVKLLKTEEAKIKPFPKGCELVGAVVPHAGYIYSGYEALHFFVPLARHNTKYETIVIVHPDHRGLGKEAAIDDHTEWETLLGNVSVDVEFAQCMNLEFNKHPHQFEHSGEVMIPFLQYFLKYPFQIVPVAVTRQKPEIALQLSKKIFEARQKTNRKILIIASSDFSHFLPPEIGASQDDLILKEILNFKSEAVYQIIRSQDISVCGYGPIMTLIEYSKLLSSEAKAEILVRGHSGKSSLSDRVVNYNTILFYY